MGVSVTQDDGRHRRERVDARRRWKRGASGGGSKGGGSQGGKGPAGWPSTTGNPSGGGRDNAPSKK